jgi:hypothetical protein
MAGRSKRWTVLVFAKDTRWDELLAACAKA